MSTHAAASLFYNSIMQLTEGFEAARAALQRSQKERAFSSQPLVETRVREICEQVRNEGDNALLRLTRELDCPTLEPSQLRVSPDEIEQAWNETPPEVRDALGRAASNIEDFHRKQPVGDWFTQSCDGVFLGQKYTPLDRVGLYAPNGRAAYPSTVLMLAIPARVAGVPQVALASPPDQSGHCHPLILAAARLVGISEIYKVGGAQAMAAFAYGTGTVRAVDKLVGPGNLYVSLAKKHLYGTVGIDGLYGPSEVVILADDAGRRGVQPNSDMTASQLASDLIAQAEHEPRAWTCFIATSRLLCAAVMSEIEAQSEASPRREILRESLANTLILCVDTREEACELCNLAAAEHVEIWSRDALHMSTHIRHAGAIFLNTPVPLGDYIAGPSHTLPTGATARFAQGVGVDTFLKRTSIISASRESVRALANDVETLANLEELPGHAKAVCRRAE